MMPRIGSHVGSNDASRPASPAATLGVPVGAPTYAQGGSRPAHTPAADAATGDAGLGSDAGADIVSGGATLANGLEASAPFVPTPGMPTDGAEVEATRGSTVEAIDVEPGAGRGAPRGRTEADAADPQSRASNIDDGLTAEGAPGNLAAAHAGSEMGNVESGDVADAVDEAAGADAANSPSVAPPADAAVQGGNATR
jgi:hypothetical protein